MNNSISSLALLSSLVFTSATTISKQKVVGDRRTTYRCNFPVNTNADMRAAVIKPEIASQSFELVFDQIDPEKGTGRLIGNNGGADVIVVPAKEATSILEQTGTGVFQVTVIYSSRLPDGSNKAVHSRHTVGFGGEPIPSQYYGSCRQL